MAWPLAEETMFAGILFGRTGPGAVEDQETLETYGFSVIEVISKAGQTVFHVFGTKDVLKAFLRQATTDWRITMPDYFWPIPKGTELSPSTVARGAGNTAMLR